MKKEFTIYTNDLTIQRHGLLSKWHHYEFDSEGFIKLKLKPATYYFKCMNQDVIYNFNNAERIYFIYREDNDCHFNVLIKDISKDELLAYQKRKSLNI